MDITIIGAGNGANALGADLTLKGHKVRLLKTSNAKMHSEHFEYLLSNNGEIYLREDGEVKKTKLDFVTKKFEEAIISTTELVIIFVQTNYHESVIKKISPFLLKNQIVLVEPGYLATPYFLECDRDDVIVAEAESSPIDCRINEPGYVDVLFRNVRNPIGIYPNEKSDLAMEKLNELSYNFKKLDSVIEAALHNPNIIVHTVGAIMSIPRIEYSKGQYWMYKEVFTPSVWNIVETLDNEKKQILEALKLKPETYLDKCLYRNSNDLSKNSQEVFFNYAQNSSPEGPFVSNSRYITEDVSQGLVLMEMLGNILEIDLPVTSSLIDISSSALNEDFRVNGRKYRNDLLRKFLKKNGAV